MFVISNNYFLLMVFLRARNGLLVPTAKPSVLAGKIILLAKDKAKREKLAEDARKTVKNRANWQNHSQALNELIQKLSE